MPDKKLGLIKQDPWLEPSEHDINERYKRYENSLKSIEDSFGSLDSFADGYKYFGINYYSWNYQLWL